MGGALLKMKKIKMENNTFIYDSFEFSQHFLSWALKRVFYQIQTALITGKDTGRKEPIFYNIESSEAPPNFSELIIRFDLKNLFQNFTDYYAYGRGY